MAVSCAGSASSRSAQASSPASSCQSSDNGIASGHRSHHRGIARAPPTAATRRHSFARTGGAERLEARASASFSSAAARRMISRNGSTTCDSATLEAAGFATRYTEERRGSDALLGEADVVVYSTNQAPFGGLGFQAALRKAVGCREGLCPAPPGPLVQLRRQSGIQSRLRRRRVARARRHRRIRGQTRRNQTIPVFAGLSGGFKITDELYYSKFDPAGSADRGPRHRHQPEKRPDVPEHLDRETRTRENPLPRSRPRRPRPRGCRSSKNPRQRREVGCAESCSAAHRIPAARPPPPRPARQP